MSKPQGMPQEEYEAALASFEHWFAKVNEVCQAYRRGELTDDTVQEPWSAVLEAMGEADRRIVTHQWQECGCYPTDDEAIVVQMFADERQAAVAVLMNPGGLTSLARREITR